MNKIILLIIFAFFCITDSITGQASESFDNSTATGNYGNGSFTGDDNFTWSFTASRDDAGYPINGAGLLLRRSSDDSKLTSATVSGGIGNFTCNLKKGFTGGGNRQVELFVNGVSQGASATFDDTDVHVFSISGIDITGDVVVEIRNITEKQVVIDDVSWTIFPASTNTSVEFVSSTSSIAEDGTSIDVCVAIENPSTTVATTVEVALDGASTATNGTDYDDGSITSTAIVFPQVLTFPANTTANQCFTIHMNDDVSFEGDETIVLNLQNPSGGESAALGGTTQHIVTISDNDLPTIIINELLADPGGDANGDGTFSTSEDEFVELYNNGSSPVDISGFTISDAVQVRHTFPSGSIVPAGDFIVVFGGGSPMRASTSQTASTNSLGLNNTGDNIEVASGATVIASITYGNEGNNNQSLARNPDFTGGFVQHNSIGTNPVNFSPGNLNTVAILPVDLTTFVATSKNDHIQLAWQTTSELNNSHFDIQRSTNSKSWDTIDKVSGAGTTDEVQNYTFTDKAPVAGMNYYRLKQVDYDGAFEYSPIVSVDMGKDEEVSVYPNPVVDEVVFEFKTEQKAGTVLSIYNINGQLVQNNTLGEDATKVTLHVNDLVEGIYFMQIVTDKTQITSHFVKH